MLDDLSDVLTRQTKEIEALKARLSQSDNRIAELEAGCPPRRTRSRRITECGRSVPNRRGRSIGPPVLRQLYGLGIQPIYTQAPSRMKNSPVASSVRRGPGGGPERWK
jgi:hypothetical protein